MKKLLFFLTFVVIFLFSCKGPDPVDPPVVVDNSAKAEFKSIQRQGGYGNFVVKHVGVEISPYNVVYTDYLYFVTGATETKIEVVYPDPSESPFRLGKGDVFVYSYGYGKYCNAYVATQKQVINLPIGKYRFGDIKMTDQKIILELVDSVACVPDFCSSDAAYIAASKIYGRYDTGTKILTMDK